MIDRIEISQVELRLEARLERGKSRIRRLSRQQQKVLEVLHERPNLCNKEIARYCFTTENSISVTLGDLQDLGILEKAKPETKEDRRKSLWHICDQEITDAIANNNRNTETLRSQDGKF